MDENPEKGLNQYCVVLSFVNGQKTEFTSNEVMNAPLFEFILFPNPIFNTKILNVVSQTNNEFPAHFLLIDVRGRLVLERIIKFDKQEIYLGALPVVTYLYTLSPQKDIRRGRKMVN
ncbi:MAG TPA: hypothetical protein DDY13_09960 [Cytophagales bacterium]|nr:hypothetical protein [Cytophagales bacterium]